MIPSASKVSLARSKLRLCNSWWDRVLSWSGATSVTILTESSSVVGPGGDGSRVAPRSQLDLAVLLPLVEIGERVAAME